MNTPEDRDETDPGARAGGQPKRLERVAATGRALIAAVGDQSAAAPKRARALISRVRARLSQWRAGRRAARPKPARAPFDWRRLAGSLAAGTASAGVIVLGGGLFFAFVVMAPRAPAGADLWDINRQPALIMLDRHGEEIAARGARYGAQARPEALPPYLIEAFLSTEDRRFYEHAGVDLKGAMRAAMRNARSGGVVEGGSTITQQLAKNLFLSPVQTYDRKIREALLALWLEGHYTKDEILTLYLNRIYLGAGAYGVESAARTYFDKSATELTLAEAAMIAGLPKAPSTYAPTQNLEGARRRAAAVVDNLLETGAVTPFEAHAAKENPADIVPQDTDDQIGYFLDYVASEVARLAPGAPGDLIVQTTLDPELQRDAEAAIAAGLDEETRDKGGEEAALVAYDADGALRAMVGGRDYAVSQFNRAAQAKRQPGSAFKPFVYVAGLEAGLAPTTRFVDQPINLGGWAPTNYDNVFRGSVRLTEAMAQSINTVAAQVSETVGTDKVAAAARRFGVSDVPDFRAIALGAVDTTLVELAGAYLPFARGGLKPEPYAIAEIRARDGEILYQHANDQAPRVMSEEVAEAMNHLLFQVVHSGTGASARLGARPAVGKTGTTNDWRDAWFVGYTAQLTAGVWVGNDDYQPMDEITGGGAPARIWKAFMLSAHQGLPEENLPGAYPAPAFVQENALLAFYRDVARDLAVIRRDGNARRARR